MNNYKQLLKKIDSFVGTLHKKYPDSFSCKKGCADCCIAGITVWQVEYDNILDYLKKDVPSPLVGEGHGEGAKCHFLDAQNTCAIYDARPIVCRLWGMPMARDEGDVNCCEKNFADSIKGLIKPDIINGDVILKTLAAINHVYCRQRGLDPEKRFAMSDVLQTP